MTDPELDQDLIYLQDDLKRKQVFLRPPKKLDNLISNLMARRGYAQTQAIEQLDATWATVAGERLAGASRAGKMRGGVLSVVVENSAIMQELTFQKRRLLKQLNAAGTKVTDLRFQVGAIK